MIELNLSLKIYEWLYYTLSYINFSKSMEGLTEYGWDILKLIGALALVLPLIHIASSGSRWVKMVINGIERIVLVGAAGTVIYDYWGRPTFYPGEKNSGGSGSGTGTGSGSGSGNNTGGGTGQSGGNGVAGKS